MSIIKTTRYHVEFTNIDKNGNLNIMYLKNTIDDVYIDPKKKTTIRGKLSFYGTSASDADVQTRDVTVPGFQLEEGSHVTILFEKGITASNAKLRINNGSTTYAAIPILYQNKPLPPNSIKTRGMVDLIYSLGNFHVTQEFVMPPLTKDNDNKLFLTGVDNLNTKEYPDSNKYNDKVYIEENTGRMCAPSFIGTTYYLGNDNSYINAFDYTGNSATSTKLKTKRNIIVGNKTNSFDGTKNIEFTLDQIGAVSKEGDTMTGDLKITSTIDSRYILYRGNEIRFVMPVNNTGFAGGITWRNPEDDSIESTFGYWRDHNFYFGTSYDNPDGILKAAKYIGNLEGTADVSNKLGTTDVGSKTKIFYLKKGVPTESDSTVGSGIKPIFLNSGTITESGSTIGSDDIPVYMNAGTITSTGKKFSDYLPKTGGKLTGAISISAGSTDYTGTPINQITGTMGSNDSWRIASGATASDNGFFEIATADNGNEPIYVRQYSSSFATGTVKRTLTLLDGNGNTIFPGSITAQSGEIRGNLLMQNVYLYDGVHSRVVMQAFDDGDGETNNGSELVISAAGNTFIGSGESTTNLRNDLIAGNKRLGESYGKNAEELYISSDNSIYLLTNCQTIANRKGLVFSSGAHLYPLTDNISDLGTSNKRFRNITASGTVTASKFDGPSSSWQDRIALKATGDITGSVLFDGSTDVTWTAKRRHCICGQASGTATKPWYKFASIVMSGAYTDASIVFHVIIPYSSNKCEGILRARTRVNGEQKFESGHLEWILASTNLNTSDFVMAYSATAPCTVELWTRINTGYTHVLFDVISESNRVDSIPGLWTLYSTKTNGSQDAITSGYTQIVSTVATIKNPTDSKAKSTDSVAVRRVNKASAYKPGKNTMVLEEFNNNSEGLPSASWYHIYTSEGDDVNYACQLALGMTESRVAYRRCSSNTWSDWKTLSFSDHNHDSAYLKLSGGTMTGTIISSKTTSTYLAGNQGQAIINSTAGAGSYTMLAKMNSTNGYFTTGTYQSKYLLQYTAKTTVDAGTNNVTKSVTLLDESGNSSFPGVVTATSFTGKLTTARNINGMSFDGSANRVNYGSCSTAAATAEKAVACTGFALITGAEITVKFTVTNTAASPTLNVNSTGAKPIYYRGAAISAGYLAANRTYTFRYNGTQYELVGDIDTNSTYAVYSKTIDTNFSTAYRTQTKGNTTSGSYISMIRNNTASVSNSPQYGSGLAWGNSDTHGYLYMNYSSAAAYVGAGNADKLNWVKQLAFADSVVNKSGDTITGTLILSRTADAAASADNRPALIIGNISGDHLEFDGNEIMAKSNGTTASSLYLNNDGGTVCIGSGGLSTSGTIYAPNIELTSQIPFIDFHFNRSTADYTSRIAEYSNKVLTLEAANGIKFGNTDYGITIQNNLIKGAAGSNIYSVISGDGHMFIFSQDTHSNIFAYIYKNTLTEAGVMSFKNPASSGHARLMSSAADNNNRTVYLPTSGGTLTVTSSDIRLKNNIKDTEVKDALSIVNKIQFRQFDWKNDNRHQKIGVVADELEEIDPMFISKGTGPDFEFGNPEDEEYEMNPKCIDILYMTGYLGKAIQEMSSIINKQIEVVANLKKELNEIKSTVNIPEI